MEKAQPILQSFRGEQRKKNMIEQKIWISVDDFLI
jgi:hypothetical protein